MFFDLIPGCTIDKKGRKEVRVRSTGSEKRHVTVVLTCTTSGEMLPPMIIFRGKGMSHNEALYAMTLL